MLVSVSTMPAKNVLEYVKQVEQYADFMHCDVCDGIYNNSIYFSSELAEQINNNSTIPLDVHLMTKNILSNAKKYVKAGANIITAQFEAFNNKNDIDKFINYVKSNRCMVGLSLEPETPVSVLAEYIDKIDIVLIMAVKTGKSGQEFNADVLKKVKELAEYTQKYNFLIELDGGISSSNIQLIKNSGVDIVVSGSFVYNSNDKKQAIETLKI